MPGVPLPCAPTVPSAGSAKARFTLDQGPWTGACRKKALEHPGEAAGLGNNSTISRAACGNSHGASSWGHQGVVETVAHGIVFPLKEQQYSASGCGGEVDQVSSHLLKAQKI